MLFYLTNVVGLRLEVAGTLIVIAKIYDALINVPMGMLSDNTKSRWGRRRPWFLLGALLCSTWFLVIFNTPPVGADGGSPALVAWVLGALLLYSTGYAIFNVPYLAMPAEMSTNYHERTAIMSYRVIFIQVSNYRPYYLIGEVAGTGAFPYQPGMTYLTAIANAGGFTYRAKQDHVYVIRSDDPEQKEVKLSVDEKVQPGDIIRVAAIDRPTVHVRESQPVAVPDPGDAAGRCPAGRRSRGCVRWGRCGGLARRAAARAARGAGHPDRCHRH